MLGMSEDVLLWQNIEMLSDQVLENDSDVSENECGDCENGEDDNDCDDAYVTLTYNARPPYCIYNDNDDDHDV